MAAGAAGGVDESFNHETSQNAEQPSSLHFPDGETEALGYEATWPKLPNRPMGSRPGARACLLQEISGAHPKAWALSRKQAPKDLGTGKGDGKGEAWTGQGYAGEEADLSGKGDQK